MIHDDNYQAQIGAIHACFLRSPNRGCTELMLSQGTLHARQMNEELTADCSHEVDLSFLHLKGESENIFHLPAYSRGTSPELFSLAQRLQERIIISYDKVTAVFGVGVTMEFRYYRCGEGDNFHVLDVMKAVK